jgi:hypothetical protein
MLLMIIDNPIFYTGDEIKGMYFIKIYNNSGANQRAEAMK